MCEYTHTRTHLFTRTHTNKCSHVVLKNNEWNLIITIFSGQFPVNWGTPALGSVTRLGSTSDKWLAVENNLEVRSSPCCHRVNWLQSPFSLRFSSSGRKRPLVLSITATPSSRINFQFLSKD